MVIAVALVLALGLVPPPADDGPPPVLTGIFPPGITARSAATWTIIGRHLDAVSAVVDEGDALTFGPPRFDPAGGSLTVAVTAGDRAPAGYRAIRLDGPRGLSNLAIVRVDPLPQRVEVEPNDRAPAAGESLRVGTAVAGTLRPLDVDRFRVEGEPGRRVTLDWEARRLGTAIHPVLTVTGPGGAAILQDRGIPGGDRDCRAAVTIPAAGWFEVELCDNTYEGDDRARYRLRIDPLPFASSASPLGGPRGSRLAVELAGPGVAPLAASLGLPDVAGSWADADRLRLAANDVPPSVLPPSVRFRADDSGWVTMAEPPDRPGGEPRDLPATANGLVIDGRVGRPGEVDRFRVEVQAGDRFRARVEAAAAGSWLDAVVTIRDARGARLAEDDDRPPRSPLEPPETIDGSAMTDAQVDVPIRAAGSIIVEVADRAGGGGPEFGYRLEVGPPRDDFAVHLLPDDRSADPGPAARALAGGIGADEPRRPPGADGAFSLRAGTTTLVPLVVVPRGRPGTIEVEAVGLPASVAAERLAIRTSPAPRSNNGAAEGWDAPAEVHALRLRVAPGAAESRGEFRLVARARPRGGGRPLDPREVDAVVGVDAAGGPERPVVRRLATFPVRVLADPAGSGGPGRRGQAGDDLR